MPFTYQYPRAALTVDLIVFGRSRAGVEILLIRRKKDPFAGRWAIPGGFLEPDERIREGALRELREETGLEVGGNGVVSLGVYDDPKRDPRERVISMAHVALWPETPALAGSDDAREAAWFDPKGLPELAFDHPTIIRDAWTWLDGVIAGPGAIPLFGPCFRAEDVDAVHRHVRGKTGAARPWLRRMCKGGVVVPGAEPGTFRPAKG